MRRSIKSSKPEKRKPIKVLFIVPYPLDCAPSQRLKFEQHFAYLKEHGIEYDFSPFVSPNLWKVLYKKGHYGRKIFYTLLGYWKRCLDVLRVRKYDLMYMHLEAAPFGPPIFERLFKWSGVPIVYDIDDLIYLPRESPANPFVKFFRSYDKIPKIINMCDKVIVVTKYLVDYTKKYNKNTVFIPPTIDTISYKPKQTYKKKKICIGWTGSYSTSKYLVLLKDVLRELAKRYDVKIKVIGDENFRIPGLKIKAKKWKRDKEVEDIQEIDIGLYPLPKTEWVLGKGGLKALQYMGMGIPTICTAYGAATEIIKDGENGFLADTKEEWVQKISQLVEDTDLRERMGKKARETVEERYSVKGYAPVYRKLIEEIAQKPKRPSMLDQLFTAVFTRLFQMPVSGKMRMLLQQLKTITMGTALAGGLMTLFTIYAARVVGPASYGTYMLIFAIANVFLLPMLFGLHTASIHMLAKSRYPGSLISTALALVAAFALGTGLFLFSIGSWLFNFFFIPTILVIPCLLLAALFSFYYLGDGFLRGLQQMRLLARLRVLQAIMFSVTLLLALMLVGSRARSLYFATAFGLATFFFTALWILRNKITLPAGSVAKPLLRYGFFAFLWAVTGSLLEMIDKLLLNWFVSPTAVGIYSAYVFSSITITSKLLGLLMTVLFPFFSATRPQHKLFTKLNRLIHRAALLTILGTSVVLSATLLLFGKQYPFSPSLVALFSLVTGLYFLVWGKLGLVSATSLHGVRAVALLGLGAVVLNTLLNLLLIPRFTIHGAAIASILTLSTFVLFIPALQRSVIKQRQAS